MNHPYNQRSTFASIFFDRFKSARLLTLGLSVISTGMANASEIKRDLTGIYGGLNIGGIFNTVYLKSNHLGFTRPDEACNTNSHFSSVYPGLQLGYVRQLNSKLVLGVEADYTNNLTKQSNMNCMCDINPDVSDTFIIKNQQQGSLRGRFGYAHNHLLPFFMAGGSLANITLNYHNEDGDYYSKNTTTPGWLVGAGLEWQLAHAWSIRAEYFYAAYNNALNMKIPDIYGLFDPNGGARVNLNANNIRAAINHWF